MACFVVFAVLFWRDLFFAGYRAAFRLTLLHVEL